MGCAPTLGKAKIKKMKNIEAEHTQPQLILALRMRSSSNDSESLFDFLDNRKVSLFTVREEISALEKSANPSYYVSPMIANGLKEVSSNNLQEF
mmetsp:Transcript_21912/g.21625  ORF Transcript_21912/g.21625 Transcript_21912/m.21625 type:complete len:94 (+) Transcript_21912:21-302(+)